MTSNLPAKLKRKSDDPSKSNQLVEIALEHPPIDEEEFKADSRELHCILMRHKKGITKQIFTGKNKFLSAADGAAVAKLVRALKSNIDTDRQGLKELKPSPNDNKKQQRPQPDKVLADPGGVQITKIMRNFVEASPKSMGWKEVASAFTVFNISLRKPDYGIKLEFQFNFRFLLIPPPQELVFQSISAHEVSTVIRCMKMCANGLQSRRAQAAGSSLSATRRRLKTTKNSNTSERLNVKLFGLLVQSFESWLQLYGFVEEESRLLSDYRVIRTRHGSKFIVEAGELGNADLAEKKRKQLKAKGAKNPLWRVCEPVSLDT